MMICTLLTFALCADPTIRASIAFDDLTVPIVWTQRNVRSCMDLGRQPAGQPGDARMEFGYSTVRPSVRITDARIELSAYRWPRMSAADARTLRAQYRAALWHEIGHLVTARTSIAAANGAHIVGETAFAQINADQTSYDAVSEHGIRQDRLQPELAGENTVIFCSGR